MVIFCFFIKLNNKIPIVVNIYDLNSKSDNEKLLDTLEDKIANFEQNFPDAYLLIGGDFNVD